MKAVLKPRTVLLLAASLIVWGSARADIYGFVDDDGEVHLANHPTAEKFEVWAKPSKAESQGDAVAGASAVTAGSLAAARRQYQPIVAEAARAYDVSRATT